MSSELPLNIFSSLFHCMIWTRLCIWNMFMEIIVHYTLRPFFNIINSYIVDKMQQEKYNNSIIYFKGISISISNLIYNIHYRLWMWENWYWKAFCNNKIVVQYFSKPLSKCYIKFFFTQIECSIFLYYFSISRYIYSIQCE